MCLWFYVTTVTEDTSRRSYTLLMTKLVVLLSLCVSLCRSDYKCNQIFSVLSWSGRHNLPWCWSSTEKLFPPLFWWEQWNRKRPRYGLPAPSPTSVPVTPPSQSHSSINITGWIYISYSDTDNRNALNASINELDAGFSLHVFNHGEPPWKNQRRHTYRRICFSTY